jgi:transposase
MNDIFYRDRAQMHAPKTADEIERAAKDLAASGYSDHTVAAILNVDVAAVRQMIGERTAA